MKKAVISGSEKIDEKHVREAKKAVEEECEKSIKTLSKPHKLMLLSALTTRKVGEAYTQYNKTAEKFKLPPLTERRLREILGDLELMGFIEVERRGREWLIKPTKWFNTNKVKETLQKELE